MEKIDNNINYNLTISGLRGFAVLIVLFFHLEFFFFKGGFVGVDIFFVISGYLISVSIVNDIENKKFSFKKYFERRLKRILPSYLAVLLISYLIINFIFIDKHLNYSINEILYSLVFLQNFYYWDQAGYFGLENLYKPLLNTWSLAVEFQFYLFFPFLFYFLRKYILILILFSLILSIVFAARNFSYFLIVTRFFEFGFGIIIYFLKKNNNTNNIFFLKNIFFILGVLLLLFSTIYLDGEKIFPGLNALLPCFGAFFVIYCSGQTKYDCLFNNRLLRFFGDISYSLYLIHWPLIIFYKYYLIKINLDYIDQIIILSLSIIFSYFLTFYYEIYYYKKNLKKPKIKFKYLVTTFCLFIIVVSINSYYNLNYHDTNYNKIRQETKKEQRRLQLRSEPFLNNNKKRLLVIGDSHGGDLFYLLKSNSYVSSNYQLRYLYLDDSCLKKYLGYNNLFDKLINIVSLSIKFGTANRCTKQILKFNEKNLLLKSDLILIANRYSKSNLEHVEKFIDFVKEKGKEVILFNNNPRFIDPYTIIKLYKNLKIEELNEKFYIYQDKGVLTINKNLKKISESQKIPYIDKYNLICKHKINSCDVLNKDGKLFFGDKDHFSNIGYEYYGNLLVDGKLLHLIK